VRRPSPALVVACIALLVALGGTSYATVLNVPRNSVGTAELKRNAVKPAKLAPNAVRTAHVLNGSLLAVDFRAGQIPAGAKGDKGDKGEKGDQGAPGLSGYERVATSSPATNATFKSHSTSCPAGKRAVGGGGDTSNYNAAAGPFMIASRPNAQGTAWTVTMVASPAQTWTQTVYVVCANVAP